MTKFPAARIVRSLLVVKGKDSTMFSDKTTFGRSIKVWGQDLNFYHDAVIALENAGYNVDIVRTKPMGNYRLHVRG